MVKSATTVNTNITAARAGRHLRMAQGALSTTIERISSGKRINSANDDAAGSAVSANLKAEASSIGQGVRNANDGISIIQVTEAAYDEVTTIFQRMRELAVQSASDTLQDDERAYVHSEYKAMYKEVLRLKESTDFNGISLTNGDTGGTITVQVGAQNDSSSSIDITLGNLGAGSIAVANFTYVDTAARARNAITSMDYALAEVNRHRSALGATQNRLQAAISNGLAYNENLNAAVSQIEDTDYATESAKMTKNQIIQQAGVAALGQAKNLSQSVLSLF